MDSFCKSMDSFCIVVTNLDSKKIWFVPYKTNPDLFCIVDHESLMFSKDLFVDKFRRLIFKRFDLFSRIQQILTNPDESLVHRRTLYKPKSLQILGFGFANPYWFQKIRFLDSFCRPFLKDSFCEFVSWIRFWKIRFVDSFCKNKNSKLLDLFCFGRIRVQIPHP